MEQQQIDTCAGKTKSKSPLGRVVHLDMLRGVAALAVLLGHARMIFLARYPNISPDISTPQSLLKILYFLTGFHHYAVIIFFVLSGFFIASSVLRAWQTHRWSWKVYLINRLTRLYLVLIPALVIGAFWDFTGAAIFTDSTIYQGDRMGLEMHPAWSTFLGNALYLQGILVKTFGSNTALWSLSYEFWYYILFPIFVFVCSSRLPLWKRLLYACGGAILLIALGQEPTVYFLIWLMGAGVSMVHPLAVLQSPKQAKILSLTAFMLLILVVLNVRIQQTYLGDFEVGVATTFFVYAILHLKPFGVQTIYAQTAYALADFSYTLYLTHLPLLIFLGAWLAPKTLLQPTGNALILLTTITIGAIAYAFFISRFTEAKTELVRLAVMRWLK